MATAPCLGPVGESYWSARGAFGTAAAAAKYPSDFGSRRRHRRERQTILDALKHVPPGAHVLDLPCGSGRATRLLLEQGYRVTGADCSEPMVKRARQNYRELAEQWPGIRPVAFEVRDIMATGFEAERFDAVLCNRLFHHFREPETRRAALRELRRISTGPIIVSFFNSFAVDAVIFRLRHLLRGTTPADRIPISTAAFAADVAASGLRIKAMLAARWGVSPHWHAVVCRGSFSNPTEGLDPCRRTCRELPVGA